MIPLQAVTPEALVSSVGGLRLDEARRIVGAIHRRGSLDAGVPRVRRSSLDAVRAAGALLRLEPRAELRDPCDGFVKYSFGVAGGEVIETVRIPLEQQGRFSVCVSSQAGCGLGCLFCATAALGLRRNLEAWEIVEQVRLARRGLDRARGERVTGIVFQGMGEPLANADAVLETVRVACEPSALAIDARNITVSTAGIPAGIERLAREASRVRLAVSIGSARSAVRRRLIPIDRAHPLEEVLEAAAGHARRTGLAPMWAVTLLDGVNDTPDDARALAELARAFADSAGTRPRVSIVPYNPIADPARDPFRASSDAAESEFRRILREAGVPSRRRYSGGGRIDAACGQLAGRA